MKKKPLKKKHDHILELSCGEVNAINIALNSLLPVVEALKKKDPLDKLMIQHSKSALKKIKATGHE